MPAHGAMVRRIGQAIADALFPSICMACRKFIGPAASSSEVVPPEVFSNDIPVSDVFSQVMKIFLCENCRNEFLTIDPPVCYRCGLSFPTGSGDDHLCGACIKNSRPFAAARALGEYGGPLMKLIHSYKYLGKLQLARPLGTMLLNGYLRNFHDKEIDCIIPVPLHRKKLRKRGFNQVNLMLDNWKKILNSWHLPLAVIPETADLLTRSRNTDSQTGLDKSERRKNVRGAFALTRPERIAGSRVLLVDDVYTTGATLEECARLIEQAGAEEIFILTLARTM